MRSIFIASLAHFCRMEHRLVALDRDAIVVPFLADSSYLERWACCCRKPPAPCLQTAKLAACSALSSRTAARKPSTTIHDAVLLSYLSMVGGDPQKEVSHWEQRAIQRFSLSTSLLSTWVSGIRSEVKFSRVSNKHLRGSRLVRLCLFWVCKSQRRFHDWIERITNLSIWKNCKNSMTRHEESPLATFTGATYRIISGIIGDIAKIEDLSGSVQRSMCQGLDLLDKQAEISNPRVWRKNRRGLLRKKGVLTNACESDGSSSFRFSHHMPEKITTLPHVVFLSTRLASTSSRTGSRSCPMTLHVLIFQCLHLPIHHLCTLWPWKHWIAHRWSIGEHYCAVVFTTKQLLYIFFQAVCGQNFLWKHQRFLASLHVLFHSLVASMFFHRNACSIQHSPHGWAPSPSFFAPSCVCSLFMLRIDLSPPSSAVKHSVQTSRVSPNPSSDGQTTGTRST